MNKANVYKNQIESAKKTLEQQLEFHIKIIHSLPEDLAKEYLLRQVPDIVNQYKRVTGPASELFGIVKHTWEEIKRFESKTKKERTE